ncbi:YceI family protein [Mycolicibacterium smegmatis]|uniref:YceI family protein n=1 Tax=Mycolicibacterium smegmatis TaxID=1772 RepID=UPI001EFB444F|nr:YceI family protein [Mycolicibacterium smegmatis]ULN37110.1 YceI family protein [Mycolicibacterium smegmatis]
MTTLQTVLTASTGHWTLAPDQSTVRFRTKTMWGLVPVNGTFTEVSGSGTVDDNSVTGRVVIGVSSVRTGIGKRDEHLRSADFFDAATHPEITAEVSGAQPSGDGALLDLTLTVRGTSRPLRLPVGIEVLDDGSLRVSGRATLDRRDFGVSGNMVGMVGSSTDVAADLVFTRG